MLFINIVLEGMLVFRADNIQAQKHSERVLQPRVAALRKGFVVAENG